MTDAQFKEMMKVLNQILESTQNIEDLVEDANFMEHNEKVEWNLWEIHNIAKFLIKGRSGTLNSLPDTRPERDAERKKNISED
jgi:hypothetical protein